MPTLPQEQLDEIELTIQDLLDQLESTTKERDALKAEVLRLRERLKTD
jgi:regulator of replication initiation timing